MPSLTANDRVSLCLFSFSDGRRCRTPRTGNHPYFCFYHAQKEAQSQAAASLGKDLACFFSGDYLSGCDLSTALARLIPAVVRGDIKPKLARTVAYLMQTLMQSIRISQHEYINAFGTDGWRKAVRTSVNTNFDYRFPPAPKPEPQQSQPQQPTPTSSQTPSRPQVPAAAPQPLSAARHSPADAEVALSVARSIFPPTPTPPPPTRLPRTTVAPGGIYPDPVGSPASSAFHLDPQPKQNQHLQQLL